MILTLPKYVLLIGLTIIGCGEEKDIELLLQDPREFNAPADRCDSTLCTSLVELLNRAHSTIDFAVYGARNQTEILEALLKARDRGVTVRGYMDKDVYNKNYYSSSEMWMHQIGSVRDDLAREQECTREYTGRPPPCSRPHGFKGPLQCLAYDLGEDQILVAGHASRDSFPAINDIMHNKFFVVDGERVWTGSANLSDSGTGGYNANAVVVMRSKQIAAVYTAEFEQLWNRQGKCSKLRDGVEEFDFGLEKVSTWFSPQDASLRYGVGGLIAKAKKHINVAVFFLTAKYLTADLIDAHRRGVDVRVIIDATAAKNGYSKHEVLREAGIPVRIENWGSKMHMKAASIDGHRLVLGSMNWTSAGESSNDENTLLVESSRLARQFDVYYDDVWQSIPETWQKKNARPDPESPDSGSSCSDGVDNDFDDLADANDPGCLPEPPLLPALPPHRIITPREYEEMKHEYPMMRPKSCAPGYPDWYVCLSVDLRSGCKTIPYRNFSVEGNDPLRLDGDGDGVACEGQL
ncbi:MAG: hypothetical protein F4146_01295 [Rhodothermaceae bacterium]|nr:hypothetical protein [Rhodothermaceae bacterium]